MPPNKVLPKDRMHHNKKSYPGIHSLLVNEFDGGQEIIQEGAQEAVDSGEGLEFSEGVSKRRQPT
jgi:hypothetical protein